MMNEQLIIYLWSISEGIRGMAIDVGVATLIITGVAAFLCSLVFYETEKYKRALKQCINYLLIALLFIFFGILIPSKQDLALILLYPTAKTTVQNFSPEMSKFHEVLNLSLDNQIKELKSGKVKN